MESLWLLVVGLTPLVVGSQDAVLFIDVPKVAVFRILVGFLAVAWAVVWALKAGQDRVSGHDSTRVSFADRIKSDPTTWILLSAGAFLIANLLSTLFSLSIRFSFWGSNPGTDGYSFYNAATYFVLFAVIATRLRTREQLWRLLGVVAITATLSAFYALLQHFGIASSTYLTALRARATFGNALFAGAFFTLSIPLTAGLALAHLQQGRSQYVFVGWIVAFGIQISGLMFTLSRGPWGAAAIGLMAFFGLAWLVAGRKVALQAGIVLGVAGIAAMVFSSVPSPALTKVIAEAAVIASTGGNVDAVADPAHMPAADPILTPDILERVSTTSSEVTTGGLNGRIAIWNRSLSVAFQRPYFDDSHAGSAFLRHLVGYGPETHVYVTATEWVPELKQNVNASAHNYPIQLLVELGAFGLVSFGLLVASVVIGSGLWIRRSWRRLRSEIVIVYAALLAALIARSIEQMVGVARLSDTALFWVVIALLVAVPRISALRSENTSDKATTHPTGSLPQNVVWHRAPAVRWSLALVIAVSVVFLTFEKNINYVKASASAASSVQTFNNGDLLGALEEMDDAISSAPNVDFYYVTRADMIKAFTAPDEESRLEMATVQYNLGIAALDANPLSHIARMTVAEYALELSRLGVEGKAAESIAIYTELTQMLGGNVQMYNNLAIAYLLNGQPENALLALERYADVTQGLEPPIGDSLYLRGVAHEDLGEVESAMYWLDLYMEKDGGRFSEFSLRRLLNLSDQTGIDAKRNYYAERLKQIIAQQQ